FAHPQRSCLGRRNVRGLYVPAPGGRRARTAGALTAVACVLPEILSLGVGCGAAAARQRLLDADHYVRRLRRCSVLHHSDAAARLGDDCAVRLAVPWAVASIQTRG